jgi:hypothetical protein
MWLLGSILAIPALGGNILSSSRNSVRAIMALAGLALLVSALGYVTINYLRDWAWERNRE